MSLDVCVLPRNAFVGVNVGFLSIVLALGEFRVPVNGDDLVGVVFSGEDVDVSVASVFFFFLNLIRNFVLADCLVVFFCSVFVIPAKKNPK